jgi:hypothetical protein
MENPIEGKCVTMLDDVTMTVTKFARVPNVGERVACTRNGKPQTLRVTQVTHDVKNNKPYIIVELHL